MKIWNFFKVLLFALHEKKLGVNFFSTGRIPQTTYYYIFGTKIPSF